MTIMVDTKTKAGARNVNIFLHIHSYAGLGLATDFRGQRGSSGPGSRA